MRKGTDIPYLSHLLGVASIAMEYGANEDETIGALLHDAGEDAGGDGRIEDIRTRFGDSVADIVKGCTDAVTIPKPPWKKRKEDYIAHIAEAPPTVRLVSASDKLHNARSILRDFRIHGDSVWSRFNAGSDGTLWYYRSLVTAFRGAGDNDLIEELDRIVTEIEQLAGLTAGLVNMALDSQAQSKEGTFQNGEVSYENFRPEPSGNLETQGLHFLWVGRDST